MRGLGLVLSSCGMRLDYPTSQRELKPNDVVGKGMEDMVRNSSIGEFVEGMTHPESVGD